MAVQLLTAPAVTTRSAYRDAPLMALSLGHAALLVFAFSIPVVALGLWWNANTISHNFIHRPFFRARWRNRAFSVWLSLLLGIPQSYWRARHLAHHADSAARKAPGARLELACVVALWTALTWLDWRLFVTVYVPGYAIGLALCFLQGHYEHVGGGTTSHYGRIYNTLLFNDGYHVEHHRHPGTHWSELPAVRAGASASAWPPVLRWLDAFTLDALEGAVLRSPRLQRFVLDRHERAFRRLLPHLGGVKRATIVGGGLFPRTAIILRKLLPDVALTIVDRDARHLEVARARMGADVRFVHAAFDPAGHAADLVVVPLAFRGDRTSLYRHPPAPVVLVHDWIWARRPVSARVSWWLLKRLNLVIR